MGRKSYVAIVCVYRLGFVYHNQHLRKINFRLAGAFRTGPFLDPGLNVRRGDDLLDVQNIDDEAPIRRRTN